MSLVQPSVANPLGFFTGDDLTGNVTPPLYIMRPILPRGRIVLLVGNSTAGKTPFCYQLATDLLGQRDFLDYFPNESDGPLTVAFIDAESLEGDIRFRIGRQRLARPVKTDGSRFLWTDRERTVSLGLSLTDLQTIKEFVEHYRVDVLIIDNLWGLSGGLDISKGHVATQVISHLNQIICLPWKPTVIVLHHPRKSAPGKLLRVSILEPDFMSWFQELSGSMVWGNRSDVRLGLERTTRKGNEWTVFRGRHRVPGGEQDIGPLYLRIDEKHDLACIDKSPELLENLGDKAREIAEKLRGRGQFTMTEALVLRTVSHP